MRAMHAAIAGGRDETHVQARATRRRGKRARHARTTPHNASRACAPRRA
ncbi:hypothetical protein BURMUCGD2M_6230 [Burkholderia multivorans CGD2M]|uniref:Uncharacterized protein n=1 Tax=Burkholderia multivorans CGD2 TaxID=513052 RepID=B9BX05_9BURK|nr:hypothetical protein BURMUCGD2_6242 [Burkholderia multivorans CGD2]EEE13510.1 hypothetical protein BURMUCGD2M_6230 [Burkholderia multivorans CGD2M]